MGNTYVKLMNAFNNQSPTDVLIILPTIPKILIFMMVS